MAAFLEEFESNAGVDVSLRETSWEFGSRPEQPNGLEDIGFAEIALQDRRGEAQLLALELGCAQHHDGIVDGRAVLAEH